MEQGTEATGGERRIEMEGRRVMEIKAPCRRPLGRTQKQQIGLQALVKKPTRLGTVSKEMAYLCFLYALFRKKTPDFALCPGFS